MKLHRLLHFDSFNISTNSTSILLVFAIFLFSCRNSPNEKIYKNDFEEIDGWGCSNAVLIKGDSKSGSYMCELDQKKPYSITFKKKFKEITDKHVRSVEVEAWVKISTLSTRSSIVLTIDSVEGHKIYWEQQPTDYFVTEVDKWVKIRKQFLIPDNVKPDYELLVYAWQKNEGVTYVDDLFIKVIHDK